MTTLEYLTPRILLALWLVAIIRANNYTWINLWWDAYWLVHRAYHRAGKRLTKKLVRHFKYHNGVLGTSIPNVTFLKLKSITVINNYGQNHTYNWDDEKLPHTGFWKP